jgi:molecular chaperone GrpE
MQKEKLKDNKQTKEEFKKTLIGYKEDLQRLQAEFDNFRKRTDKEKQEIYENANQELIIRLLDILDNFELALKHIKDKGIEMIYSQLYSLLENKGLKIINAKGKFNPEIHEALISEEGNNEDIIIEELQKGYYLNNKVIRHSKVKISKIKK